MIAVHSDMDGDFDQFEEIDDNVLNSLCLDFPHIDTSSAGNVQCDSDKVTLNRVTIIVIYNILQ